MPHRLRLSFEHGTTPVVGTRFQDAWAILAITVLAAHCGPCAAPHPTPASTALAESRALSLVLDAAGGDPGAKEVAGESAAYGKPVSDLPSWLDRHGVTGKVAGSACFEVGVGAPPAVGLLCRAGPADDRPVVFGAGDRTVERVYRADGTRLVEVWKGTVGIYANWVDLIVDIEPDGARLELRDRLRCSCERAFREDDEKTASSAQPAELSKELRRACKARGFYVWSGTRYVRDTDASAGAPDAIGCRDTP